jgi:tRNA G18 (ribose-2'-O)-methylase SpoU
MFERIERLDDPRIAAYRDVPDPELVRSRGLFIAEGRLVVRRLIEDGRWRFHSVLVSEAARKSLHAALDAIAHRVPVYVCAAGDFLGLTGYDIHRGCLALVSRPPALEADVLVDRSRTIVVLEAVTNADNVGGIFRNVAAFGADGILLSPACCDPLYRKAIRTSMGAVFQVPFVRAAAWPEELLHLRAAGFTIVALTPREPSQTLPEFSAGPRPERMALVVGTEGAGLTMAVEEIADRHVRIPIDDTVDSVNVAVAVGIALYALRQR